MPSDTGNIKKRYLVRLKLRVKKSAEPAAGSDAPANDSPCFCGERFTIEEREQVSKNVCYESAKYLHEGNSYCILHYPKKEKSKEFWKAIESKKANGDCNFRAVWFPDVANFATEDWKSCFREYALTAANDSNKKIDFTATVFSDHAHFNDIEFGCPISFEEATFLNGVNFKGSKFTEANFNWTTFSSKVSFDEVIFSESKPVSFWATVFDEKSHTYFQRTQFQNYADFRHSYFFGYVYFSGIKFTKEDKSGFDFRSINLKNPGSVSFRDTNLCSNWFIDADAHKFSFEDIEWNDDFNLAWESAQFANRSTYLFNRDIEQGKGTSRETEQKKSAYQLLGITFRQIAVNAEENGLYQDAQRFRKEAFNAERLDKKQDSKEWRTNFWRLAGEKKIREAWKHLGKYNPRLLDRLYRWTSSYGESWAWALFVLIFFIVIFFPVIYFLPSASFKHDKLNEELVKDILKTSAPQPFQDNIEKGILQMAEEAEAFRPLDFPDAVIYSIKTGTLQKPEQSPANLFTEGTVIFETIFIPLQIALLALAIRRKFMR
ncbi:MAG TPA: hypothetical protein VGC76_10370 [Pyrinomonadaceae bacterium]|jgi:uncharacterized protein YjbI with pentapeptide repeats